jgi:oligopeptide/dipeptide ABC transporter ATP-binding protein
MVVTAPDPQSDDLVVLSDVSVDYTLRKSVLSTTVTRIHAVDRVSLTIKKGQTMGLVGATGSGKSTIAQLVMGMVAPSSGSVHVAGVDLAARHSAQVSRRLHPVQVVMQDPFSSLDPRMRVADIIAEPLTLGSRSRGRKSSANRERVDELLKLVGLSTSKARVYPHQLSGGQRQRVSIARALAPDPELIVLDEPTSALDVSVRAQILTLLRGLQERIGVTFLVISHDLITVAYLSNVVATMFQGRIVELAPMSALHGAPHHPYTLELIASAPSRDRTLRDTRELASSDNVLPDTACKFASRCALRTKLGNPSECVESAPELRQVDFDHRSACHFAEHTPEFARQLGATTGEEIHDEENQPGPTEAIAPTS